MRAIVMVVAAVVAVAACVRHEPTGVTLLGVGQQQDSVEGTGTETELMQMKARWAGVRDGRDYSFVTQYYCFCPGGFATLVRVRVRGTSVASVREVESGASRAVGDYYTIEELYDRAIAERARDGRVRVSYSATTGIPIWLTIGNPEYDAGVTYRVQDVVLE